MVALVTKISYDRALVCITQVRSLLCQWFLGWVEILFLFLEPIVGWEVETMHYRLKLIESVHSLLDFASHFVCLQIFQIGFLTERLISSVSKYSRYIFRG